MINNHDTSQKIKKLKSRIDRLMSRPFTAKASLLVDRLLLQVRHMEGRQ